MSSSAERSNKRAKIEVDAGAAAAIETSSIASETRSTAGPTCIILSGSTLTLSLRYLLAKEVGRAEFVCKQWLSDLRGPGASGMWRQIAVSSSSEALVEAVALAGAVRTDAFPSADLVAANAADLDGDESYDSAAAAPAPFDFRKLAAGLCRRYEEPIPEEPIPDPTLSPEDLFMAIQLSRRVRVKGVGRNPDFDENGESLLEENFGKMETVAAYCCTDCTAWFAFEEDRDESRLVKLTAQNLKSFPAIRGLNKYSREGKKIDDSFGPWNCPFHCALENGWEYAAKHYISIHLFRRDDGSSVCLAEDIKVNEVYGETRDNATDGCEDDLGTWFRCFDQPLRLSESRRGEVAKRITELRGMYRCEIDVNAIFRPTGLPEPGSDEEMEWLKNSRLHRGYGYGPHENHCYNESANISHFDFSMKELSFGFRYSNNEEDAGDEHFKSKRDLLLILDGLDWK